MAEIEIPFEINTYTAQLIAKQNEEIARLKRVIRHLYLNDGICYDENCDYCQMVCVLVDDRYGND